MSPETNGETTLTTSYGWRVKRSVDAAGRGAVEWRCPACWQRFKVARAPGGSIASTAPPPTPRGDRGQEGKDE